MKGAIKMRTMTFRPLRRYDRSKLKIWQAKTTVSSITGSYEKTILSEILNRRHGGQGRTRAIGELDECAIMSHKEVPFPDDDEDT